MHNHMEIMFFQSVDDQLHTQARKSKRGIPRPLMDSGRSVFTVTAHNPRGEKRSKEKNRADNAEFWDGAIQDLYSSHDLMLMWHNRAFNPRKEWAEDGWALVFPPEKVDEAREHLIFIAATISQSVIYEWYELEGKFYRRTLPAADDQREEEVVEFVRVEDIEGFDPGERFLHYQLQEDYVIRSGEPGFKGFKETYCGNLELSECQLADFNEEEPDEDEEDDVREARMRRKDPVAMQQMRERATDREEALKSSVTREEEAAVKSFVPDYNDGRPQGMDPEQWSAMQQERMRGEL